MRLALIADIHGNVPALDAVLAELEREEVDQVVCLGDVSIGPQPVEALERVRSLGCPVIIGNWDAWLVVGMPQFDGGRLGEVLGDLCAWAGGQLSPEQRDQLTAFAPALELALPDEEQLLAFHGSPRSFEDSIFATTPDAEVEEMLDGRSALVHAGGHTHFQLVRRLGESLVVNPGSIGLPFRRALPGIMEIAPWAEYGLLRHEDGRLSVELRRTPFDLDVFLAVLRDSGMPHADWWAARWTSRSQAVS
jgi:predicted phosphodiesterase